MFEKHKRQVNRQHKNMSKSITLDCKKATNKIIKNTLKDKGIDPKVKKDVLKFYYEMKQKFVNALNNKSWKN